MRESIKSQRCLRKQIHICEQDGGRERERERADLRGNRLDWEYGKCVKSVCMCVFLKYLLNLQ